jgi:hypothetical protein
VAAGAFAGPYIPTTTVAVARNADVLTYTGADVANIKTLACTFNHGVGVSVAGLLVALSEGIGNERAQITVGVAGVTDVDFRGLDGGVIKWQLSASNAYSPGTYSKASFSMATNDIKMDKDGIAQTQDTSASLPTVTELNIGHLTAGSQFNGPVNHIYGWTRNLSQSELGAIDRA